ncbi:MAG: hypothetical protein JNL75_06080 [Chitinophagales bacterium]|nr:hypothetical protein [Chitinophagales bacterium]
MKYINLSGILLCIVLSISSCKTNLDTNGATALLQKVDFMDYQKEFTTNYKETIQSQYYNGSSNNCNSGGWGVTMCSEPFINGNSDYRYLDSRTLKLLEQLEKYKYISVKDSVDNSSCCEYRYKVIHLEGESKNLDPKHLIVEKSTITYITITPSLGTITGIKNTEEGKRAEIEFELKFTCSFLGNVVYQSHCSDTENESFLGIAEMYNDGWRITSIQKKTP